MGVLEALSFQMLAPWRLRSADEAEEGGRHEEVVMLRETKRVMIGECRPTCPTICHSDQ